MIVSSVLGAVIQVAFALLLGFIFFLFMGRGKTSFPNFLGLRSTSAKPVLAGIALGVVASAALLAVPGFSEMAKGPGTVPGETLKQGLTHAAVVALVVTAIFKTALAEELLFRGLLGKRLIGWLGFRAGNLIQAAIFGALHSLLALTPLATGTLVVSIVLFSAALGWINGWLNERMDEGSILPGWACHASANLCSYLGLAFGVL
ncbi:MAG TPA: CPBP family intramembrane glutamic endopeptidase [Allosphingosinicella sp.]|nr:CPBP family intramembrane glutamic endopeptidase [Allosphingosinicella sp.]